MPLTVSMPEENYVSVSIPAELWSRLRKLPLRKLGYATPTEVARLAIVEKCNELESKAGRQA